MITTGPVPLCYMAHPVGTGPTRPRNIVNAKLWIRTLVETIEHVAFVAPWIPYVEVLDEATHRERGMRDDLSAMIKCTCAVFVGGRMSPGMSVERDCAISAGMGIIDLTASLPHDPLEVLNDPTLRLTIQHAFAIVAVAP